MLRLLIGCLPPMTSRKLIAWGMLREARAIPLLVRALGFSEDVDVRKAAKWALVEIGEPAVLPLIDALLDPTRKWGWFVVDALDRIGDPRAAAPCRQVLKDRSADEYARAGAAKALGRLKAAGAFDVLVSILQDGYELETVRRGAATGLGLLGDQRAFVPLTHMLSRGDAGMRWDVAAALGDLGDPRGVDLLIALLDDEYPQVCVNAAKALGKIGDERALPALRRLYERLRGGPWAMWAGEVAQAIKLIEDRQQH